MQIAPKKSIAICTENNILDFKTIDVFINFAFLIV